MNVDKIIFALRRIKVEAGSLMCMGCGHEHNCGIHGCAIMSMASDRLANDQTHIAALQQEIKKLRSARRWIPVTERLPENNTPVLVNYIGNDDGKMHPDGVAVWTEYVCLWWEGSLKDCDTEVAVPITHWMPLPEAPEVE